MRVKDTAMGAWFRSLSAEQAALYIAQALYSTRGGVFWDIVKQHDLKASTPRELGQLVMEHLQDWELDRETD